jgi:hypothetical protein
MSRTFNQEAKVKLTQLINEGISVLQEVDTLNEGLNDTVKAIAEAIKIAHKQRLHEENEANEELNTILETVGKTS